MVKKVKKYLKFVVCCALILSLIAPSYAALSASDGSAFVTKAEFDSALADFNSRLTTFEAGINSKIDSQVTSYLDRNGIWNGEEQIMLNNYNVSGVLFVVKMYGIVRETEVAVPKLDTPPADVLKGAMVWNSQIINAPFFKKNPTRPTVDVIAQVNKTGLMVMPYRARVDNWGTPQPEEVNLTEEQMYNKVYTGTDHFVKNGFIGAWKNSGYTADISQLPNTHNDKGWYCYFNKTAGGGKLINSLFSAGWNQSFEIIQNDTKTLYKKLLYSTSVYLSKYTAEDGDFNFATAEYTDPITVDSALIFVSKGDKISWRYTIETSGWIDSGIVEDESGETVEVLKQYVAGGLGCRPWTACIVQPVECKVY